MFLCLANDQKVYSIKIRIKTTLILIDNILAVFNQKVYSIKIEKINYMLELRSSSESIFH